ncbi:helix-turn-helix transcriptional regulator [Kribbella sp. NPDC051952]|uniref:helix-turn-helix domain-containing protein n=1 Tax=Kribbella sp. NPDC051952 TaxID=3154851 RepID=UPI00343E27DD
MDDITDPIWGTAPVRAALASGDLGMIIRRVREAHHLTLAQLGARCGYSPSTVSRLETGRQPLRDLHVLRSLADALGIPAHLLGLADTSPRSVANPRPDASLRSILRMDEEIDPMRRRTLLAGIGGLAGSAVFGDSASADPLQALESTVLQPPANAPTTAVLNRLGRDVAAAQALFRDGRYSEVTGILPRLLPPAMAAHASRPSDRTATQLAELYTLATELMIKVGHDHLAWTTADRALQAAYSCDDILTQAFARRAWAMVLRRAGRTATANQLVTDTAAALQPDLRRGSDHLSVYGSLMSTAAYTTAMAGDRDSARTLIDEAADAARHILPGTNRRNPTFDRVGVDLYRISIARVLGDPGTAIDIARQINPATITTVERRGQYWTDIARSYHQWGRSEHCYRALLAAEQAAPDEVRHRSHIQVITRNLLQQPDTGGFTGLRSFANRVGVSA